MGCKYSNFISFYKLLFPLTPSKLHICLQLNIIKYTFNMEITDISIEMSNKFTIPMLSSFKNQHKMPRNKHVEQRIA